MKKVFLFLFVAILTSSCNAQDFKNQNSSSEKSKDSINQPKGSWKVNKEYDENGNIMRYDSIYSWSSSGNLKGFDNDSIFNKMQSMMQKRFSMFQSPNRLSFSEHDSIMKRFFSNDFFKDDFFSNGMSLGMPNMDDMIKHMDSMRAQFFNDNNRYIIPPEEKKKTKKSTVIDKNQV
jgi:hypothetical protein